MDQLSGRLSLRVDPAIFTQEFRALILGRTIERQIAYSFFLDAMSPSGWRLELSESGWPTLTEQTVRKASERFTSISVPQAINMPTEQQREQSMDPLRNGLKMLAQRAGEWGEQTEQASAEEIEQAEFGSTVDSLVPLAADALLEEADPLVIAGLHTTANMTNAERREMLEACPIFWCTYKLLASIRSHMGKITENDLWDLQHVASAAPYVDCLACDRRTRHICAQLVKMDEKYGTKIISKPEEILAWVRSETS